MGTDIDTDEHFLIQHIRLIRSDQLQRLARGSDFHRNGAADPLKLYGLSSFFWIKAFFFRIPHKHAIVWAPLKDYEPVDMFTRVGAGRPFSCGLADHPACLAVTDGSGCITGEIKVGG